MSAGKACKVYQRRKGLVVKKKTRGGVRCLDCGYFLGPDGVCKSKCRRMKEDIVVVGEWKR